MHLSFISRFFLLMFIYMTVALQSQAQSYPRQTVPLTSPFAPGNTDMKVFPHGIRQEWERPKVSRPTSQKPGC